MEEITLVIQFPISEDWDPDTIAKIKQHFVNGIQEHIRQYFAHQQWRDTLEEVESEGNSEASS